ncbi:hypothetical protein FW320_01015 [Azospirillum sp. Vi22]|uniref:hypothetical protein n=1 Tax=Azospirillum baldaniorum TaxID=1064539 RepID=UPI0011A9A9A0|nr:hypothetical protein [Azospirillum baldaniorum]NUB04775.1 hypothetical protein [Azospirillum baldaniorum]TWA60500.1 hypothetical protein FBZ84_11478 [Azospirillum baldaniorum]
MDWVIHVLVRLIGWALVGFITCKPRLTWLLLGIPGGLAAAAIYATTGTLTGTTLFLIALATVPAALALRWATRRLW